MRIVADGEVEGDEEEIGLAEKERGFRAIPVEGLGGWG